jgi:hypothetical protein
MFAPLRTAAFAALLTAASAAPAADVFVNGVRLDDPTQQALERMYGVPLQSGRYWYDNVSGVWGYEGGPSVAQIHPGLRLGGALRRDASRGNTGVIVNGRELHAIDVANLQRCTPVLPGRYWVAANGIGGYEGGPPLFNLAQLCGGGGGSGGGDATRTRSGVEGITTGGSGGGFTMKYNGKVLTQP